MSAATDTVRALHVAHGLRTGEQVTSFWWLCRV